MKRKVLLAACVVAGMALTLVAAGGWSVRVLENPPPPEWPVPRAIWAEANNINERGDVVGSITWEYSGDPFPSYESHMALWTERDGLIDLGAFGEASTWASGIDNRREIVGKRFLHGGVGGGEFFRALMWTEREGSRELLDYAEATDVNDRGQVVGRLHAPGERDRGFLWSEMQGLLELSEMSSATVINNRGDVVGHRWERAGNVYVSRAVFWTPQDGARDLGTLGGVSSTATGINDRRQVVGYSTIASGQEHASLWTEQDGMLDLGGARAHAVNDRGEVVGFTVGAGGRVGFLWNEQDGMVELPLPEGGGDCRAYAVNNRGQIVGVCWGYSLRGSQAVLWEP